MIATLDGLSPSELLGLFEFMSPEEQYEANALLAQITPKAMPQPGAQTTFYNSPANLTVYGGAAGAGKTYGAFLRHAKHLHIPGYTGVIFRKTRTDLTKGGSLWDTSYSVFPAYGAKPRGGSDLDWTVFRKGQQKSRLQFAGLQYENDKFEWQGAQLAGITFDEATHFSWSVIDYLMSRNRSTCGITPFMDLTCNPDPGCYLVNMDGNWGSGLISWWIDDEGYPIPERCGVIRWMVRAGDAMLWADSYEQAVAIALANDFSPEDAKIAPRSVTFIPGNLQDNAALMAADPAYRAKLLALPLIERMQLLGGNWKVSSEPGIIFKGDWWGEYDPRVLPQFNKLIWAWDTGVKAKEVNDPTAGVLLGATDTHYYVLDVVEQRWLAPERFKYIKQHFEAHPAHEIGIEDKYSGSDLIQRYRDETNLPVIALQADADKATRAQRISPQVEAGRVLLPAEAPWKAKFLLQIGAFDGQGKQHDDMVDAFVYAMIRAVDGVPGVHQVADVREEYADEAYTSDPFSLDDFDIDSVPSVF